MAEGAPKQSSVEKRPDEHLPPPTGRGGINQGIPAGELTVNTWRIRRVLTVVAEQGGPTERFTTTRNREPGSQFQTSQPQPLAPAPDSRTVVDNDPYAEPISAGDTLTGATSQDVYRGLGRPAEGMTSAELHHDGRQHRKRSLQGTDQYGTADDLRNEDGVDLSGWKEE